MWAFVWGKNAWKRNEGEQLNDGEQHGEDEQGLTAHYFFQYKNKGASNEAGRSHAYNKLKEVIQRQLIADLWYTLPKNSKDAIFYLGSEKGWRN